MAKAQATVILPIKVDGTKILIEIKVTIPEEPKEGE